MCIPCRLRGPCGPGDRTASSSGRAPALLSEGMRPVWRWLPGSSGETVKMHTQCWDSICIQIRLQFTSWSSRKNFLKRDRVFQRLPYSFKAQKVCLAGQSVWKHTVFCRGPADGIMTQYEAEHGAVSLAGEGGFQLWAGPTALDITGSRR